MAANSPTRRHVSQCATRAAEAGQELVDAIVGAIDANRTDEVRRVQDSLEPFGLDDAFIDEIRLSGVPSRCDGECWAEVA
jgi:hypothetical protein